MANGKLLSITTDFGSIVIDNSFSVTVISTVETKIIYEYYLLSEIYLKIKKKYFRFHMQNMKHLYKILYPLPVFYI